MFKVFTYFVTNVSSKLYAYCCHILDEKQNEMLLNRASNDFERQLIAQTKQLSEINMTRKVYSGKDSKTPLK